MPGKYSQVSGLRLGMVCIHQLVARLLPNVNKRFDVK